MKPNNKSIYTVLIFIIFFITYFSLESCKKITNPRSNPDEKDTITYNLLNTSIYVKFFDANTNEQIITAGDAEIKVRIVGKSKSAVVDIIGLQKEEYTVKQGFLTFGLLPDAEFVPSSATPVNFTIIAQLSNYITATKEVSLTSEGDYMLNVYMVNISNPPPGVVIKKLYNVGTLINGVVQGDIVTSTQNNEAVLTIPAGTKLLTSDSAYLAGKLNITLVYYNGLDDKALAAIPGGVTGSILENSIVNSGVFYTAGVIGYEIYDTHWYKAAIIEDDSIELSTAINTQNYNPVTGANVIAGDIIPYYSYMIDTGLWSFAESVFIVDTLYSGLYASVKTQSMNCASFSWFEKNTCNQSSKFQISGSCSQCGSVELNGIVRKQVNNSYVSDVTIAGIRNKSANIAFSTGNTPVYIEWGQNDDCNYCYVSASVSPQLIDEMCTQQTVELPLTDDGPLTVSITANFYGLCPSDTNILILPSFGLYIRPINSTCWRWTSMEMGVAQICNVIYGETYVFGTYYDGIWKEWQVTVSDETIYNFDVTFSSSVCTDVLGIL